MIRTAKNIPANAATTNQRGRIDGGWRLPPESRPRVLTSHHGHPLEVDVVPGDPLNDAAVADGDGTTQDRCTGRDAVVRGVAEGVVLAVVGRGFGVALRTAAVGTTGRTGARVVGRGVARVVGRALRTPGGAVAAGNPGTTPLPSTGMAGRGSVIPDGFPTRRTTPT